MVQVGGGADRIDSIQVQFGCLDIYPQYIVTTTDANYQVTTEDFILTSEVARKYFEDNPWVLIANRKNPYTLDAVNLDKGFAGSFIVGLALVVRENNSAGRVWLPEQLYSHSFPVRAFSSMQRAVEWANQQIGR